MQKISIIYKNTIVYALLMRILYGKNYLDRYASISDEIPDNVSVLDVCCGDCMLYKKQLKGRVEYTGVDINPMFIKNARENNISVLQLDVFTDVFPNSDFIVMQASLYQFIPHFDQVVKKMLQKATKKVIICEPVRNLSDANNKIVSFIARNSANPGSGHKPQRFTEEMFREYFTREYSGIMEKFKFIPGNRELMVVLNAGESK